MSTVEERVTIDRPVDQVYQLLSHDETEWLEPFLRLAAHRGEQSGADLRARLKPGLSARIDGPRTVDVTLGRPTVLVEGNAIEIGIHIETNGYRCVFTALEARLLISKSEGDKTSLSLLGAYREPEPLTGGIDDALVAQHAAQTTVRVLLDNLRVAMESESSPNTVVGNSG
ncbi:MAG TPA: hypothetical protein VKV69_03260 [Actinomycetota bacterium]|nr:hypothetical protein [Actinomycetota bacterium]